MREKSPSRKGNRYGVSQNDFYISANWFFLQQRLGRINFLLIPMFVFPGALSVSLFNKGQRGAPSAVWGDAS